MKILNYISLIAQIIVIATFIAQGVEPQKISPLNDTSSFGERIGLLGGALGGIATVTVKGFLFVLKVAVVLFVPWTPARLVYRASIRRRWIRDWEERWQLRVFWPRVQATAVYIPICILSLAVIFPTFVVSEFVWEMARYLAQLR